MKKTVLPRLLPVCAAALLTVTEIPAATYYWDINNSTTGFGTAGGTLAAPTTNNSTQGWSTSATGVNAMSGTTNTTTSDALNFGTGTASYGLAAGTITVSGTVAANTLTIGSQSGAIVLSGGEISLGGTTPTITVNNASDTISSVISGSAGLTKNGTGILTLSGANTYTGTTTLNAGTLRIGNNSTFGASSVVVNSASVMLDSAAGTSYTLSNNITLIARGNIGATANMGNLTLSGIISGTGDLKLDTTAGVTTLTGLNAFTVNLIVDRKSSRPTSTGNTRKPRTMTGRFAPAHGRGSSAVGKTIQKTNRSPA